MLLVPGLVRTRTAVYSICTKYLPIPSIYVWPIYWAIHIPHALKGVACADLITAGGRLFLQGAMHEMVQV